MQPWQIVPRNAGIKMMFEVIIFVAHEEGGDSVGQDRSGAEDSIGLMFEERVLAHAANIDERINNDHGDEPGVNQPEWRYECDRDGDQYSKESHFEQNPTASGQRPVSIAEDRYGDDVRGITDDQAAPMHEEFEP